MINGWIDKLALWLTQNSDCVLVTVMSVIGSAPREVGASMVVRLTNDPQQTIESVGSIGGGHLEWQSLNIAQSMLSNQSEPSLIMERFNLGARLGQCCGGRVLVLFERISHLDVDFFNNLLHQTQHGQTLYRYLSSSDKHSTWQIKKAIEIEQSKTSYEIMHQDGSCLNNKENNWKFSQVIESTRFHVYLFGAGHIAQALVKLLLPLAVKVHWIETRDYQNRIENIDLSHAYLDYQETDIPEQLIETALPNSFFIVMTHDHGLDFQLCQSILKRQVKQQDIRYFGMIGSTTKRANFERRLLARGVSPETLTSLICPMGITGIHSKEPNLIAIAITAQLLQYP